jgi:hypothetical protein
MTDFQQTSFSFFIIVQTPLKNTLILTEAMNVEREKPGAGCGTFNVFNVKDLPLSCANGPSDYTADRLQLTPCQRALGSADLCIV